MFNYLSNYAYLLLLTGGEGVFLMWLFFEIIILFSDIIVDIVLIVFIQ